MILKEAVFKKKEKIKSSFKSWCDQMPQSG